MVPVASLFSQLLQKIRKSLEGLVQKHGSERYAKGFSSWTHLVAMLFLPLPCRPLRVHNENWTAPSLENLQDRECK